MQISSDEVEQFLKELKELSDKHNIYIDSEGYQNTFLLRLDDKGEYYYDTDEFNNLFLEDM